MTGVSPFTIRYDSSAYLTLLFFVLLAIPLTGGTDDFCRQRTAQYGNPRGVDHADLSIHKDLGHVAHLGKMLPLPCQSDVFGIPVVKDGVAIGEPIWNPAIHLALKDPDSIAVFPAFKKTRNVTVARVTDASGSTLAYTNPFRLLSAEGVRVIHDIVMRERHRAHRNHRNTELRGLYYLSPFVRDMLNDATLLKHLSKFTGEDIVPHNLFMDAASVNFGSPTDEGVTKGTVDPWHFDSVAYVAVALISNITDMVGGELQLIKREKNEALDMIEDTFNTLPPDAVETIAYGDAGVSILAQGSEVVHHVTQVKWAYEPRLSLVMAFEPKNPFQPDKTVLDTWERFDAATGSAPWEFFRAKAHAASMQLEGLTQHEPPTNDRQSMARRLRLVANELLRVAALLDQSASDFIGYANETALAEQKRRCT